MNEYPDSIKKKWPIAKHYIRLECSDGSYNRKNCSHDKYIEALEILFHEGILWFKHHLLDLESQGINGSLTEVVIKGKTVVLEPKFIDDEEEFNKLTVEIDRDVLLRLTNEWQALVKNKMPEIFIVRKNDGELLVTDKLPEGIELAKFEK